MENFTAYNPTALHFGKDVLHELHKVISTYGSRVLLIYGRKSVKQNGIYQLVMDELKKAHMEVYEYSGIRSNPIVEDVDAAADLGRAKNVDVILAVGGGSVIDSAKAVSVTIPVNHTVWDFYTGRHKPAKAVPLVAVLTLAATGSEMNPFAVLQNNRTRQKWGWGSPLLYPGHSFLDPSFTMSVPAEYTAYGIADLVAHSLEAWFGEGDASLSDRIVCAIILEAMEYGPLLMKDLSSYHHRESIMYASTLALNGLTMNGRRGGDWGVHGVGHVLSVLYDVPHGASLTIVYPAWLRLMRDRAKDRICNLGKGLFGVDSVEKTIDRFEQFFTALGCPVRLSQAGISMDKEEEIFQTMIKNRADGRNYSLSEDDYRSLVRLMA